MKKDLEFIEKELKWLEEQSRQEQEKIWEKNKEELKGA